MNKKLFITGAIMSILPWGSFGLYGVIVQGIGLIIITINLILIIKKQKRDMANSEKITSKIKAEMQSWHNEGEQNESKNI